MLWKFFQQLSSADWALKWIESDLSERLIAFAAGKGFSPQELSPIYWLLTECHTDFFQSTDSRDEGVHCDFAAFT
jgi:hypothetical protein